MEKLINSAITQKKKLVFFYDGSTRVVDPYFFGIYKNKQVLIGEQTGGVKFHRKPGISIYILEKIHYPEVLDILFKPKMKLDWNLEEGRLNSPQGRRDAKVQGEL